MFFFPVAGGAALFVPVTKIRYYNMLLAGKIKETFSVLFRSI